MNWLPGGFESKKKLEDDHEDPINVRIIVLEPLIFLIFTIGITFCMLLDAIVGFRSSQTNKKLKNNSEVL